MPKIEIAPRKPKIGSRIELTEPEYKGHVFTVTKIVSDKFVRFTNGVFSGQTDKFRLL